MELESSNGLIHLMSVEFKVVRIGDKVVQVTTNSPLLTNWEPDLPLVSTERTSSTIYDMPDEQARDHLTILMLQR